MKCINGFEGLYEITTDGKIFSVRSKRFLNPNLTGKYPRIKLSKGNKDYVFAIHNLVAYSFLEPPKNIKNPIVNHRDGNKQNYKLSNLEFTSSSGNTIHAQKSGLKIASTGHINGPSKLSEKDVIDIINSNKPQIELSKEYGVSTSMISQIKNRKKWSQLDPNKINPSTDRKEKITQPFNVNQSMLIPGRPNYRIDTNGSIENVSSGYQLSCPIGEDGYKRVFISGKNYYVHRLVAICFIKNEHELPVVNHKDGNKLNNNVENLEWCSHSGNSTHAFDLGLRSAVAGEKVGTSKLKENQVLEIFYSKDKYHTISKKYGISIGLVSGIKNKRIWKYLLFDK